MYLNSPLVTIELTIVSPVATAGLNAPPYHIQRHLLVQVPEIGPAE